MSAGLKQARNTAIKLFVMDSTFSTPVEIPLPLQPWPGIHAKCSGSQVSALVT